MKIALVTTTINVPRVLRLFRNINPDVRFFVAVDKKTPPAARELVAGLGNAQICDDESRKGLRCAGMFHKIQQRNYALLEAIRWKADIIVTMDDDNVPLLNDVADYFGIFQDRLEFPWSGIDVTPESDEEPYWFDVGSLQYMRDGRSVRQRGIPIDSQPHLTVSSVVGADIGVCQGICLGDPDTSAIDRLSQRPEIHNVSTLLRAGVVFRPWQRLWTVFNTQNTAFRGDLAPAMMVATGVGRYDDILASIVTQRVMRERGLSVYFGQPFAWQQRNDHVLLSNLSDEMWGQQTIEDVAHVLDHYGRFEGMPVPEMVEGIYRCLRAHDVIPESTADAAVQWIADVKEAMK